MYQPVVVHRKCTPRTIRCESKKQDTLFMSIFRILSHCYTRTKFSTKLSLQITPYLNDVAVLPCENMIKVYTMKLVAEVSNAIHAYLS